ncbi:MAG: type III pantothenate kinase [Phormidesmis sp.]
MADMTTCALLMALIVGNTRLHWGLFDGQTLVGTRHTPHLVTVRDVQALMAGGFSYPDQRRPQSLWVASVVAEQTALCLKAPLACYVVERSRLPLANLYPTLGIDRAINLLGAKERIGWPALVIDAGTALTFTAGVDKAGQSGVYGGAILPGMRLQGEALRSGTAALEEAVVHSQNAFRQGALPSRWACDTSEAIASGLIYSTLAILVDTLTDWWETFPAGKAVLTGGDGPRLHYFLRQKTPEIASRVFVDSELMFYGMSAYCQSLVA